MEAEIEAKVQQVNLSDMKLLISGDHHPEELPDGCFLAVRGEEGQQESGVVFFFQNPDTGSVQTSFQPYSSAAEVMSMLSTITYPLNLATITLDPKARMDARRTAYTDLT